MSCMSESAMVSVTYIITVHLYVLGKSGEGNDILKKEMATHSRVLAWKIP